MVNGEDGASCSYPASIEVKTGDIITLEATPRADYIFKNWSGEPIWDGESTTAENPIQVKVTNAMDITANFVSESTEFFSADKVVKIDISNDTRALNPDGSRLDNLEFGTTSDIPASQGVIIGAAYELQPDGATFYPPVTLRWTYNPNDLPVNTTEEDLYIMYYDKDDFLWKGLESTVIPEINTVNAPVSHFTTFALASPPNEGEAYFTISSLNIFPAEVKRGETVTISFLVTNTGDQPGTRNIRLNINGEVADNIEVYVGAGTSEGAEFTASSTEPGTYAIDVEGISGSFTVNEGTQPTLSSENESTAWLTWVIVAAMVTAIGAPIGYQWWKRKG